MDQDALAERGYDVVKVYDCSPDSSTHLVRVQDTFLVVKWRGLEASYLHERNALRASAGIEGVIGLYEAVDADHLLVLEHGAGGNLHPFVRDHYFHLTYEQKLRMLFRISSTVMRLLERGIIHGDLKTSNILINTEQDVRAMLNNREASSDFLKLIDFEYSSHYGKSPRNKGAFVGSFGFAAPETFVGAQPSEKSEVYSLGAIAYVLFTGRPPYNFDVHTSQDFFHRIEKVYQILMGTGPAALLPLPDRFQQFVYAMVEKKPEHRPTIEEICREVSVRVADAHSLPS